MKELTVNASLDQLDTLTAFIDEFLEEQECSMKAQMMIDVAVDEIFSNVAYYAYSGQEGKATVMAEMIDGAGRVRLTFKDSGVPFNPLENTDPDVTLSAEERKIGGLGIFMVKKTMENLQYRYEDGKNIFSFEKTI